MQSPTFNRDENLTSCYLYYQISFANEVMSLMHDVVYLLDEFELDNLVPKQWIIFRS